MNQMGMKDAEFGALSQEILKRGDSIRFKARGSSMLPLIQDGDLLTIQPVKWGDIRRGQVVFYQTAGRKCVIHRVIRIEVQDRRQMITTRGDASPGSEEQIHNAQVLGRVVKIHRGHRRINPSRNLWWILSRTMPGFLPFLYLLVRVQRKIGRSPTFFMGKSRLPSQGE